MSDLPLFTRKADERIAALEAALKKVSDYAGRLEYKLAAEREWVRVLRDLLCQIYNSQAVTNNKAIDLERWAGDTLSALQTTAQEVVEP